MDRETEGRLLKKLDELVFDQDQIVTNAILSEKLDVSLSECKYILEKYEKLKNGMISVTYLISGKLKTGEYSIQIFDSILLKDKNALFKTITDRIVYSVQRQNSIDVHAIALSEKQKFTKTNVPKGSIVGDNCTQRLIKRKELPPLPPQKNFEKQKASSFFKPVVSNPIDNNGGKKESQGPSTNDSKPAIQKKAGNLARFFSQTEKNEKASSSSEDIREPKRPKMEIKDETMEVKNEQEESKDIDNTSPTSSKVKGNQEITNDIVAAVKKPKKVDMEKKHDGKKRKRIIVETDSEDDIFANDEEENMDVNSDEEKQIITLPKDVIPKNKRRKAVEKVFTDEDGYVVTRTEYVLVSASDSEDAEEKPKVVKSSGSEQKKTPPEKVVPKAKKGKAVASNQPTLMSFFKKK